MAEYPLCRSARSLIVCAFLIQPVLFAPIAREVLAARIHPREDDPVGRPTPLPNAHSHNDYAQARPLYGALDNGFCSVEADVFLVDGKLLVGHERGELKPERTLERLYLDPLRKIVRENGGHALSRPSRFYLLIDVKTEAKTTYTALDSVLARYADILSVTQNGKYRPGAITAVVSGNRAVDLMAKQEIRFAGIDGRLSDLASPVQSDLMPWISDRWFRLFRWQGNGPMPPAERQKLRSYAAKAHEHGRLIRFWGTPEREELWRELLSAGVDLINTDKLAELRKFLQADVIKANDP